MVVEIGGSRIDYVVLYKLLKILYEKSMSSYVSVFELFNEYRKVSGVKVSYEKFRHHIDYAKEKELIEVRGERPQVLVITKKGIDFLFLFDRIKELVSESF